MVRLFERPVGALVESEIYSLVGVDLFRVHALPYPEIYKFRIKRIEIREKGMTYIVVDENFFEINFSLQTFNLVPNYTNDNYIFTSATDAYDYFGTINLAENRKRIRAEYDATYIKLKDIAIESFIKS
jgi:hypothetical protein